MLHSRGSWQRSRRDLPNKDKVLSFDDDVMRLMLWFVATDPKRRRLAMRVGSVSDVVQETCVSLLKVRDAVYAEVKWSTIVCNQVRWTLCRMVQQRKRQLTTKWDMQRALEGRCAEAWFPSSYDMQWPFLEGEHFRKVLAMLRYRDRIVCELRYGFADGEIHTLNAVGVVLGINKERVRQIEARVICELRKPEKAKRLVGFVD
jgi:RNA polymerase sigma factor (sigma-70 family)